MNNEITNPEINQIITESIDEIKNAFIRLSHNTNDIDDFKSFQLKLESFLADVPEIWGNYNF